MNIRCLMVVNAYLHSSKFNEIYSLLYQTGKKFNISFDVVKNDFILANTFKKPDLGKYNCCLFWDKDIILGKYLEQCGLRLFNTADSIRICDDKALTHIKLLEYGIKMPHTMIAPMTYPNIGYTEFDFIKKIMDNFSFPIVVKESKGSFGMQVYLANNEKELLEITKKHSNTTLIFQEFISFSKGHDVRINMVADKCCAAMERYSDDDFRANVTLGSSMKKYIPTSSEIDVAKKVMTALNLDYAGVDLLFSKDGIPYVCEVNSNAHFKNILDCTGINVAMDLMEHIYNQITGTGV